MKSKSYEKDNPKGERELRQVIRLHSEGAARKRKKFSFPGRIFRNLLGYFNQWTLRVEQYFLQAVQSGKIALFPSAMQKGFGLVVKILFLGMFRNPTLDPGDRRRIQNYSQEGGLVYVMYCRSVLDFLYFNHFFLNEDLPLAQWANGINLRFFLPFWRTLKIQLARFFYRKNYGEFSDSRDSLLPGSDPKELIKNRKPILIFLTTGKSRFFAIPSFPAAPIDDLIQLQKQVDFPIYILPQLLIWKKKPDTLRERSFFDEIFGDSNKPLRLRRVIHFLRYYRRAKVKFGEALNLKEFLAQQDPNQKVYEAERSLRWVLRHYLYREQRAITGPEERSRSHTINRILRHRDLHLAISRWMDRTGKSLEEGQTLAKKYVEEMVPNRRWSVIAFFDKLCRFTWKIFFDGVIPDTKQMERVREIAKDYPILYVPNHRSHIDYLVVSWILYTHQMVMPLICAGINMNFWPAGPLFRRAGAFFIRREYPEPDLYPTVLSRYIREILIAGQAQMFFIEGGRSRTGKLLRPKYGILSKVLEGFRAGVTKDVMFVPISVGYERILEEKSYSEEASGGEKTKEDLGALLRFMRKIIRNRYGKIYVNFGEPISLSRFAETTPSTNLIDDLGQQILYGINRVSVVLPTAFVSLILLSHRKRSLSKEEITQKAEPLMRYLKRRKVQFSNLFYNPDYAFDSALQSLKDAKLIDIQEEEGTTIVRVDDLKRLSLNFYKNNIIHFFVTFSFLSLSVLYCVREVGEKEKVKFQDIEKIYHFLRNLLNWEFYFRPKEALSAHIRDVLEFFAGEEDVVFANDELELTPKGQKNLIQYREIVFHSLETYSLLLHLLRRHKGKLIDEKDFLKEALQTGRKMFLQGRLERKEALSKFSLQNGLKSLMEKGLLRPDPNSRRKNFLRVTANEDEILILAEPLEKLTRQEIF